MKNSGNEGVKYIIPILRRRKWPHEKPQRQAEQSPDPKALPQVRRRNDPRLFALWRAIPAWMEILAMWRQFRQRRLL